ncbi:MAG: ATP synthase F1 subunit epsilon [Prolixibacteraceae bacterium]|nr:ATP synthase F1 subunit epsilon [Prolixibacteraceae bacterium]
MHLEIITPEKVIYSDKIKLIKVPGVKGSFEILKNHAPVISSLEEGTIKVITEGSETLFFKISGGAIECKMNQIVVLANNAARVV